MARRRKSSRGSGLGFGLVVLVVLMAIVPQEAWALLWILAGVVVVFYVIGAATTASGKKAAAAQQSGMAPSIRATTKSSKAGLSIEIRLSDDEVPLAKPAPRQTSGFRIPKAPKGFGSAKWIPAGESVEVANTGIPGGMIYVGTSLSTKNGDQDPCLIDPSCTVGKRGDYTESDMGYWPSYSSISSRERRAYLNWLADGRKDPKADIGYVFLFFYGLERRVLVDAVKDPAAKADLTLIAEELNRLIGIYGPGCNSFRRYGGGLLDWIEVSQHNDKLYARPIPKLPHTYELPIYLRLALGQAAIDGVKVSPVLALAWVRYAPSIGLRTPAQRCAKQFDALFMRRYEEAFDGGLVLARNRTKLKFFYHPASSAFFGQEITRTFGDTPDVTAVTGSVKKLQQIVDEVTADLDAYSRFVGKSPDAIESLDALLLLPMPLWPESAKTALTSLKVRMAGGMLRLPLQELLDTLGGSIALTRNKIQSLARLLESENVGFEPDVLSGARTPKADSSVVIFALPSGETHSRTTPAYQAALLTLELASAVAAADGDFNAKQINHLREQIQGWSHLTQNHRHRLIARLRLLIAEPMTLTALRKRLAPLSQAEKEAIGSFMATVAQADGKVSPDEVKLLEKVYKALGIESKKVFRDLHAVAAGEAPTAARTKEVETGGFTLDAERIAELQRDTRKVSALLSSIFTETEEETAPIEEPAPTVEEVPSSTAILGLDEAHSAFAHLLLSRPEWSLEEIKDAAADLDLMLDGALEALNEAAFDAYGIPFTEGEDPIEVNAEIVETLES